VNKPAQLPRPDPKRNLRQGLDLLPFFRSLPNTTEFFGSSDFERDGKVQIEARVGSWTVDDFVAVEAPKLNRDQQVIRQWLQSLQHQLLAAYRIQ
jgi:hypothetical protein